MKRIPRVLLVLLALGMAACGKSPEPAPKPQPAASPVVPAGEIRPVLANIESRARAHARSLSVAASGFQDAVKALLDQPDDARLKTARNAWNGFYGAFTDDRPVLELGALMDTNDGILLARMDSLPILPGYVDSLAQWPDSGIVNDDTVPLTRDNLLAQQGMTDAEEVSVGFQVVQFLLWGEPDHPRTVKDLTATSQAEKRQDATIPAAKLPQNRRRQYLQLATALLSEDASTLASHWSDGGSRLKQFDALPAQQAAGLVLQAMDASLKRLALLISLKGDTQPAAGTYMFPDARVLAMTELRKELTGWLKGEGDSPASGVLALVKAHSDDLGSQLGDQAQALARGKESVDDIQSLIKTLGDARISLGLAPSKTRPTAPKS